mgnify:CR=1 FL=1
MAVIPGMQPADSLELLPYEPVKREDLAVVGVSAAPDACKCGTKSEQIANCSTSIHGCGCLRHWIHWQYNAQASADGVSGATAEWFESSTGAAEHALVNLFNALDKPTVRRRVAHVAGTGV